MKTVLVCPFCGSSEIAYHDSTYDFSQEIYLCQSCDTMAIIDVIIREVGEYEEDIMSEVDFIL